MITESLYGLLRILVVGPLAYLLLIVILRISGKRTLARMNAFDFVVTVVLGRPWRRCCCQRTSRC